MAKFWLTLAMLAVSACTSAASNGEFEVSTASDTGLPCGADPGVLGEEPAAALGNTQHPGLTAHVFEVEDDIGALDIQKFFFAHCGGMDVVDEPRALLGDIAWEESTAEGTRFGTVAAKQPPRVVVITMELECLDEACPDSDAIYETLSAFAYTLANAP